MKATHTMSDFENFKDVMISFVSKALSLTKAEEQSLLENSRELSQQSTLPDLIAHLSEKGVEASLIERLREFGKDDAVLANANPLITLKTS
jgi:hypothetical protein